MRPFALITMSYPLLLLSIPQMIQSAALEDLEKARSNILERAGCKIASCPYPYYCVDGKCVCESLEEDLNKLR